VLTPPGGGGSRVGSQMNAYDRSLEVIGLLTSAVSGWTGARGIYHYWRDVSGANAAFDASVGDQLVTWAVSAELGSNIAEETVSFQIERCGDVVRTDALHQVGVPTRPNAVRVNGTITTARFGSRWVTNEHDASVSIGGTEFIELLRPTHVAEDFRLDVEDESATVAGRLAIIAHADLAKSIQSGPAVAESFAMVAGGEEFGVWIDEQIGVLLRVAKIHDDRVVEIAEFREIDLI
jgi:hypothetical protein